MLKKIESIIYSLSAWFERIGIVGILVMLGVTCVDVIGTKCFRSPLHGAIDIVMFSQLVVIAFAITFAQILGTHVRVDFFFSKLSASTQAILDSVINLILFSLFALIVWRIYVLGHSLQIAGEVSATLFVPLHPFVYGIAIACIPMCLVSLFGFLNSLMRVIKR